MVERPEQRLRLQVSSKVMRENLMQINVETEMPESSITLTSQVLAGAGSLDPAHQSLFGGFASFHNFVADIVALPDGGYLGVFPLRDITDFLSQFIVVRRFHEDGTLDRTFGGAGNIQATLQDTSGGSRTLNPGGIVVTPTGRIFIAATGSNPNFTTTPIVRPIIFGLTASGVLDPSFDGNGVFYPESASFPLVNGSVTNKTLVSDMVYDASTNRLTLGGTIDPSNANSIFWSYTVDINQTSFHKETVVKESGANLRLDKLAKLPTGEMVMAGGITPASGGGIPTPYLARQLENGLVLRKGPVSIGAGAFVTGLQLNNGKIVMGGSSFTSNSGFNTQGFVARFNPDALTFDPTFGQNGVTFISKDVRDIAFDKNNRLIAVGGDSHRILAARLSNNGQFDPSFGTNGLSFPLNNISSDSTEFATATGIDNKNRILVGGIVKRPTVHDRSRLARLLS
jgi:uncharacterized delta-60 repeat protein